MSYYSKVQYKEKTNTWFESYYFDRWFKNNSGPILDMGCATGNFIATHPDIIEGIEYDEDSLQICRQRGFKVKKLDVVKELDSLAEAHYSAVYAKQLIEHLANPLYFMRHVHRILKSGGQAVILTPNCPYALNKFFWDDYTHVRPLTRISLERLALDAGFKEIKIYEDFRCFTGLGKLIRIFKLSPKFISKIQKIFFISGLTLVMEVKK
ncbi:MAG: class I SAM-dependent methyltransferase [bacterium]|nr:class I SAM-dependent methyltransferase [bacterium]